MLFFVVACVLPAFVISFTVTGVMRTLGPRLGLVDQPQGRKVHTQPTALGGGIGIWLGVCVPLFAVQIGALILARIAAPPHWVPAELAVHLDGVIYRSGQLLSVLAGGTVLAVIGLLDDWMNLSWWSRLLVQLLVAIALVVAGVRATLFVQMPWLGMLATVIWLLILVNAFNFLDNMDGLSAGTASVAALMFAYLMLTSLAEPRWLVGGVMLVLAGSLIGFLCHNWPPARVFMGDSGSYFIGFLMGSMTVLGTFYEVQQSSRHVILAPLCILAVPLYDFCSVILIRLKQGRSPFQPDKSHFSHRLVDLGFKPRNAVLTIHLATLTTGLAGLLLYRVTDWSSAMLVVALITCVLGMIAILETVGRRANGKRSNCSDGLR